MMYGMALCAGVGGIELGLRLAEPEYRTICYVEREAYAASILRARMEDQTLDEAPIWDDVKSFDGKPWRGKVDVITSGFPCQPWSHAGEQKGVDDERWIWEHIFRVVCEVRPSFIFLENVPGLVSGGGLQIILGDLTQAGYDAGWMPLSAAQVGANHRRERIWILAFSIGSGAGLEAHRDSGQVRKSTHPSESEVLRQEYGETCTEGIGASSGEVADSRCNCTGSSFREGSDEKWSNSEPRNRDGLGYDFGNSGKTLSNSEEQGLEGNEPARCSCPHGCSTKLSWWAVEPSVGRVADGTSYRVDRLRACGNGVVPLVAATAWKILRARAEGMNPSPYNLQAESKER